jgi:hypothetical protein
MQMSMATKSFPTDIEERRALTAEMKFEVTELFSLIKTLKGQGISSRVVRYTKGEVTYGNANEDKQECVDLSTLELYIDSNKKGPAFKEGNPE